MFRGSFEPASEPPVNAAGSWTVSSCASADGSPIAIRRPFKYLLEEGPAGAWLYEFEADWKNGARTSNHWEDAEGLHFFMYVKTAQGFEFVIPKDRSQQAVRKMYTKRSYELVEIEGTIRPRGMASVTCPMVPVGGAAGGAATATPAQHEPEPATEDEPATDSADTPTPPASGGCASDDDCK